jgi:tetraacyldisaccharide 4'-kinase
MSFSKNFHPTSKGFAGLLFVPLSIAYGAVVGLRLFLFSVGLPRPQRVDGVRVISVGNITAGGTGKTPVTIMLARMIKENVAVVSRGYGRGSREPVQIVSDGAKILADYPDAADEALMCARALKTTPVVCAPKRVYGILAAAHLFGAKTVILDDAFSHLSAHRDKNILLLDATDPFGGGRLLPAGMLREPLSSLKRADAVVITRANFAADSEVVALKEKILSLAGKKIPIFTCDIKPASLLAPDGSESMLESLNGRKVKLLSGIGSPEQFELTVKNLGAVVNAHFSFGDHHPFSEKELGKAVESLENGEILLTTQKDVVRIPASFRAFFHILTVEATVREAGFPAFIAE